jgi:two-component system, NarL family, nitrate/nitrite response regulator NarL
MSEETRGVERRIRIAIADDHPIVRDGLRRLLESVPGFDVVGEASDGLAAIEVARTLKPDVLLLDVAMPRMGGLETLQALSGLDTRVILLTAAVSEASVLRALQLGARGVVLKETATRRLIEGIREIVDGRFVIGDGALEDLVSALRRVEEDRRARQYNLTPREREIVRAVAAGQSNKEIAEHFHISSQTVKHHLTSIFDKTGVSTRLELALFALKHRMADED